MRILTTSTVIFLLLAGLCRATFAEVMSSPNYKVEGSLQIVNEAEWTIDAIAIDKNGEPTIIFKRQDNEKVTMDGKSDDLESMANYIGLVIVKPSDVNKLVGIRFFAPTTEAGLEKTVNDIVLTGSKEGRLNIKTLSQAIIGNHEVVPKDIKLSSEYFYTVGGLNRLFLGKLMLEVAISSKRAVFLEEAGDKDEYTQLSKEPQASYLVARIKSTGQRQRLIICAGKPNLIWDSPRK